ncbi:MAG: FapA family protein, partial [Gammaproteobacteria bacterium]|nr:FapA family protein [Gammaproteobacteria bacterium]
KSGGQTGGESLFIPVDDQTLQLGKLALKLNYLNRDQLKDAVQKQQEFKSAGDNILFGELLVREGFLTEVQRNYIVSVQGLNKVRKSDDIFAGIITQNEFATNEQIDEGFETQKKLFNDERVSRSIADILTDEGTITQQQHDSAIRTQQKIQKQIEENGLSEPIAELISREGVIAPEELEATQDSEEELIEESVISSFSIVVSGDNLIATLKLGKSEELPLLEDIKEELSSKGIGYNRLPDEEIEEFLQSSPEPESELIIASGIAPEKSKDAAIECNFDTDPLKIGKMKEDGVIDFKDHGEIPQVRKGDVIAIKIPRERGANGTDVYSQKIESRKPDDIKLRTGKGAGLTKDRMSVVANFDGKPIKTPSNIIDVLPTLQIKGDVGIETGHIKFDGEVQVAGMVEKDFIVKAGSLIVNELDGATVDIRGDLNVKGGIIDSNVRVGGNLKAKYIRNSTVNVVGDAIVASEIMETEIEIGGSLLSEKCKVYETKIGAGGDLFVLDVGSDVSNPDEITLGSRAAYKAEKLELANSIKKQQEEISKITDKIAELEKENEALNEQIGEAAQVQDRAMVKKRDNPGDAEAEAEFIASEEAMNTLFTNQDDIVNEIDALKLEIEPHNLDIEHIKSEQEALNTLMEKEKSQTQHLHVRGQLFEGTLIKAARTKLTISKAVSKVSVFEETYTDKSGIDTWRMKVDGLKV